MRSMLAFPPIGILALRGDLDLVDVPTVERALDAVLATGCAGVIVDLTPVTFLCVRVVGVLAVRARRVRDAGGVLVAVGASPLVRDVFHQLGLDAVVVHAPDVADAYACVTRRRERGEGSLPPAA